MGFRLTWAHASCQGWTVRRSWIRAGALVAAWVASVGCGSRTGLSGLSGGDGTALDSGGSLTSGGSVGVGGTPQVGGSFGVGGSGDGTGGGGAPSTGGMVGVGGGGMPVLNCPTGPNDPRLSGFQPGLTGALDVADFVSGGPVEARWTVGLLDCDAVLPTPSFTAIGTEEPVLLLTPGRPGLYAMTLEATSELGLLGTCAFEFYVAGRGIRVDLCWDESTTVDLDLYVHTPLNQNPYYVGGPLYPYSLSSYVTVDTCNPINCGAFVSYERPAFGYSDSPLDFCVAGPAAQDYLDWGFCPNPRSGRDNNQSAATGSAEVVQIDNPRAGDVLRVMVQNFDNLPATPHLFAYCSNQAAVAVTLPGEPWDLTTSQEPLPGVLWRAVDIVAQDVNGAVGCSFSVPHLPGTDDLPYITVNDVSY